MRRTALLLASMALTVLLASGVALAINTIQCKTNETCNGTAGRDLMKGTDGYNGMFGRGKADVLKGFGAGDNLDGGRGNDQLVGGTGNDQLWGADGDDTLKGGAGRDSYAQYKRWGNDEIVDTAEAAPADHPLLNGNYFYVHYQGAIRGEGIVVNLNSGPGPEATQGTDTVDWSGNAIADVILTNIDGNDDRIVGNDAANYLAAGDFVGRETGGEEKIVDSDTVLGNGGDDRIDVRDASGDDTVECGEGTDTVYFDKGDKVTNCERQTP